MNYWYTRYYYEIRINLLIGNFSNNSFCSLLFNLFASSSCFFKEAFSSRNLAISFVAFVSVAVALFCCVPVAGCGGAGGGGGDVQLRSSLFAAKFFSMMAFRALRFVPVVAVACATWI